MESRRAEQSAPAAGVGRGDPVTWASGQRWTIASFIRVSAATYRGLAARRILQFWRNLKPSFSCGDFFFVHAGVRPGVPSSQQADADLLWIRNEFRIRNEFLTNEERFGKIIVHGHNPVMDVEFHSNRMNSIPAPLSCLRIARGVFNVLCFAEPHVGARRLYGGSIYNDQRSELKVTPLHQFGAIIAFTYRCGYVKRST
jgi:hypothetical protein